jgi:hypothetical protein
MHINTTPSGVKKDRYAILLSPRFEVLKGTHLPEEQFVFKI